MGRDLLERGALGHPRLAGGPAQAEVLHDGLDPVLLVADPGEESTAVRGKSP